ncbi:tRNA (adenosine(37)-N6)-threonylcarbamoyltransferase complex ATPase subunit type 1 TsaE [Palleronia pelagia]|uniref:tRNA threonylcarbamoyladenosine biosynthesis protein TsaE n=1 Tax=Palleronia pelagia TaxID=387096 RepID=A0A1H8F5J7_9RHOB|nr:tRNA (adenosine(37)-N6)-threonylcarbamoyltransferase complex ATPase subunit type 1 TsaE [Palleronia pelagia]SEN27063.1 tRNA threonylcarbamoyladenosine biosynthesis protein TsaE [Palleronia pelagia]
MTTAPHLTLDLSDADATTRLGHVLATLVGPGDCLCLEGPLGAGKSHLARSVIQALQAPHRPPEDVPSPTYTLVQAYIAGPLDILHADLYRLGDASELAELGLDDGFETALTLIEWPDRLEDRVPRGALWLAFAMQDTGRSVTLSGWDASRLGAIEAAFRD